MTNNRRKVKNTEHWLQYQWRPLAAMVYLVICIFDFIVAPVITGIDNVPPHELSRAVVNLDPQVGAIIATAKPQWQPLTLQGSGLFHISFGAILGVAAWTRGKEIIADMMKQNEDRM